MCKLLVYPCQRVTKKFLASSTSAKWQVMQLSNACFRNVLKLVGWSIQRVHNSKSQTRHNKLAFYYVGSLRNCVPLFLAEQPYRIPATSPFSHHVATEKIEEFTPFCPAASSNGALPTPSCLSEHHLYHSETRRKRHEHCRQRTQNGRIHTGTDYVVLRRRRSRLPLPCTLYLTPCTLYFLYLVPFVDAL